MDWRCGSSSKVPSLKGQIPKFKPQCHQKKKKRKKEKAYPVSSTTQ
jgi:hypothetical protein